MRYVDYRPGDTYTPDRGEHAGHRVRVLSNDTLRLNITGSPVRHILVRCEQCLSSWTFGAEPDRD